MIHKMNLNPEPFKMIRDGIKDIEMRLYDDKRQRIKRGDVIEFNSNADGSTLLAAVIDIHVFSNFAELYAEFDKVRLGYLPDESANPADMEEYYSVCDIEKYGVVGIELKPLDRLTAAYLVDAGMCPTCFDRKNGNALYGDPSDKIIYENDELVCFLAGNPRAEGHAIISSVAHYKDMSEIPDELCAKASVLAKRLMNAIKQIYDCESVYLCTMCDGPMNHFHLQLIPRYENEKRGSSNFVKPRNEYLCNFEKLLKLRELMKM